MVPYISLELVDVKNPGQNSSLEKRENLTAALGWRNVEIKGAMQKTFRRNADNQEIKKRSASHQKYLHRQCTIDVDQ